MDVIGDVKRHAKRVGYSVHGLFQAAGVDYSNWSRWCRGDASPQLRNLNKLLAVKRAKKVVKPKRRA